MVANSSPSICRRSLNSFVTIDVDSGSIIPGFTANGTVLAHDISNVDDAGIEFELINFYPTPLFQKGPAYDAEIGI